MCLLNRDSNSVPEFRHSMDLQPTGNFDILEIINCTDLIECRGHDGALIQLEPTQILWSYVKLSPSELCKESITYYNLYSV